LADITSVTPSSNKTGVADFADTILVLMDSLLSVGHPAQEPMTAAELEPLYNSVMTDNVRFLFVANISSVCAILNDLKATEGHR